MRSDFAKTLFYRINVLTIYLPPLRQRAGDLPLLVEYFTGPEWHLDPDVIPTLNATVGQATSGNFKTPWIVQRFLQMMIVFASRICRRKS